MFKKLITSWFSKPEFVDEAKAPTPPPPAEAKTVDPIDPLDAKARHSPWAEDKMQLAFIKVSEYPTFDGLAGDEMKQARVMDGAFSKSQAVMDSLSGANDSEGSIGMALKGGGAFLGVPEALGMWYMSQGFFGYQACAIIAQHWLVDKACSMSGEDAVRNGWVISAHGGDDDLKKEDHDRLLAMDKRLKIKENLVEFNRFRNIFGIRVAIFKVKSSDPLYYEKPFNIDGCGEGCYEGISQVDPYWMTPVLNAAGSSDPSTIGFYEPQYWVINGKKYHISHLAIARGPQPADILKPTYIFGGIPLTQRIYERVYAAERTANESPLMAMSKRTMAIHADLDKVLANQCEFEERLALWIRYRDNHGVKVLGTDESMEQFDTSMTDFDSIIMNQYQIVAAIARTPATKLLGTSPKGFNATGEFESKSYHEELESIEEHVMMPMLERHYELSARSLGMQVQLDAVFNPVDSVTTKERADLNKTKSDIGIAYINAGVISPEEERERIMDDEHSGYDRLAETVQAEQEPGMSPENLAALQKSGAAETAAENPGAGGGLPGMEQAPVVESVPGQSPQALATLLPLLLSGVSTEPGKPPADPTIAALLLVLAKMTGVSPGVDTTPAPGFSVKPGVTGSTRASVLRSVHAEDGEVIRSMPVHKLPKMRLNGLNLVIENPRGTIRTGIDLGGMEWASEMPDHYGYIKGYEGADGQDVDCFIGPNLRAKYVYVIIQKCPETGEFDEYKCMLCYDSPEQAAMAYQISYTPDWQGFDHMLPPMTWEEFQSWLDGGGGSAIIPLIGAESDIHILGMDDAEFKEGDHPRDKTGKFAKGGGGGGGNKGGLGSAKAGGPTALNKQLGSKKEALPNLAKKMHEESGKIPSPAEFHKAAQEAGFNIIQEQSTKYLKMYKPGAPAAVSKPPAAAPLPAPASKVPTLAETQAASVAASAGFTQTEGKTATGSLEFKNDKGDKVYYNPDHGNWMMHSAATGNVSASGSGLAELTAHLNPPKAVPQQVQANHKSVSEELAKTAGHESVSAMVFSVGPKFGYPKEGTYNGIDYLKATDGSKVSYKSDTDTWMAIGPDKKILDQGAGAASLLGYMQKNKKEATAASPITAKKAATPTANVAPVHSTSVASAKAYGHAIPEEKFKYSSKGISDERGLPAAVQQSVKAYRGSTYREINDAMRWNESFDNASPTIMKHILNLQRAFQATPGSKEDFDVMRKIKLDALKSMVRDAGLGSLDDLKPGDTLKEYGVMSTSHAEIGWSGDVKFSIKVPKGTKAIDLSETINATEKEVLLPPNSKFTVKNVKKVNGKYHLEMEMQPHHH